MPRNTTDYNFPPTWGLMTDEQKCQWFIHERAARQAMRQNTTWGNFYRNNKP